MYLIILSGEYKLRSSSLHSVLSLPVTFCLLCLNILFNILFSNIKFHTYTELVKRKYSEMNGSKHSPSLICFQFLCERNFNYTKFNKQI